jgi:histidinol dehydrogenase
LANAAASEHLVVESDAVASRIRNAGAVFVGPWTAQVAGDYAIGSNHVLPTAGAARHRGGLNAADFVKLISVQRLTATGARRLAGTITTLARAEGLEAHARSVEIRVGSRESAAGSRESGFRAGAWAKAGVRSRSTVNPEPRTAHRERNRKPRTENREP